MKLTIDNYLLESDEMCWTLKERKVIQKGKKAGHERFDIIGYYGSVSQAVTALAQREIRMSDATTFEEATKAANGVAQRIREALEPEFEVTA